jgi:hypothetical protein
MRWVKTVVCAGALLIAAPSRAAPIQTPLVQTPPPEDTVGDAETSKMPDAGGVPEQQDTPERPAAERLSEKPTDESARKSSEPENTPPSAEPGSGAKTWNLHGTFRTLAAAVRLPTQSSLDGASTSEGRLTLKVVPTEKVTIESHLVQTYAFATIPSGFSGATTFGPSRYRSLALSNTFAGSDRSTATIAVDRLAVKFAFSAFDLTIGRQPLNFAKGYFWSPLDVFLPFSPRTIDREYRPGVDAIRFDLPFGEASGLNVIGAAGAPLSFDFAANHLVPPKRAFVFDAGSSIVLVRTFTNVSGFDFSLQAGSVYAGYHAGAGVAGEVATIGVRAEATYFVARDTAPLVVPTFPNPIEVRLFRNHPRLLFGLERRFKSSIYVTAEYLYNGAVPGNSDYFTAELDVAFGETPDLSRHLVGAAVSYDLLPTLVARLATIAGFAPGVSALMTPSLDWSVAENADFQIGALVSTGRAPSFPPNDAPVLRSEFGSFPSVFFLLFKVYF